MSLIVNPFEIKTPEQNSAKDIVELFVDVFTDFKQVLEKGHTFLNGPRGSGKSMMFRYIMPDCQKIAHDINIRDLDFFSIYVPIKLTSINIPDLGRLEHHAKIILNEHLFSTYIISQAFSFCWACCWGALSAASSVPSAGFRSCCIRSRQRSSPQRSSSP